MKTLFVVFKMLNSALRSDTIEIEGKVNHHTVERAVRNKLGYDRDDFRKLISW